MDERNFSKAPHAVEVEGGAEAKEGKQEISFDALKEQAVEDMARLAVQFDQLSEQLFEIKKQIPTEAQMAINEGRSEEAGVDPEILAEYQRLSPEWGVLMVQVSQAAERVRGLKKTENKAVALEGGVDLDQKEQQLTERIGKIEAKLKAEQDGWAKTKDRIDRLRQESKKITDKDEMWTNTKEDAAASKKAGQHKLQIGELSLAYLAAKAELAAIGSGDWSDKSAGNWLPEANTKIPVYNDAWGKGGELEFYDGGGVGAQSIGADIFKRRKAQEKMNKEFKMNLGHNVEDLAV